MAELNYTTQTIYDNLKSLHINYTAVAALAVANTSQDADEIAADTWIASPANKADVMKVMNEMYIEETLNNQTEVSHDKLDAINARFHNPNYSAGFLGSINVTTNMLETAMEDNRDKTEEIRLVNREIYKRLTAMDRQLKRQFTVLAARQMPEKVPLWEGDGNIDDGLNEGKPQTIDQTVPTQIEGSDDDALP